MISSQPGVVLEQGSTSKHEEKSKVVNEMEDYFMKRKVLSVILFSMTLIAAFLGIYGQDIAYYFEDHLFYESPFKTLIIVTVTSVSLFLLTFIIEIILLAVQKIKPKVFIMLLITNGVVGFFISWWSLFVLAMWWG